MKVVEGRAVVQAMNPVNQLSCTYLAHECMICIQWGSRCSDPLFSDHKITWHCRTPVV